ncbi:MAG: molecular chaperone HtpG, partial [Bacteroidetes bacterium]|nr:molecular chaperone HtpG [Bacteroidota bacterium]
HAHPLVKNVFEAKTEVLGEELEELNTNLTARKTEVSTLENAKKDKKEEEIPQADREKLDDLNKDLAGLEEAKRSKLSAFGKDNKLAKQMVDLALLANGMLKGADLDKFVKRSVELIK